MSTPESAANLVYLHEHAVTCPVCGDELAVFAEARRGSPEGNVISVYCETVAEHFDGHVREMNGE